LKSIFKQNFLTNFSFTFDFEHCEMENRDNSIKKIIIDCAENTSIHGLPSLMKSKMLLFKILWGLFILGSVNGCVLLIYNGIIDYLKYEVLTKYHVIKNETMPLPMITFCLLDSIINDKNYNALQTINLRGTNFFTNNSIDFDTSIDILNNLKNSWQTKRSLDETQIPIEDILLSCRLFGNVKCSKPIRFITNEYSNCFQVNSGKNSTVQTTEFIGNGFGIKIQLFLGNSTKYETFMEWRGVKVFITDQSVEPDFKGGTLLPVSFHSNLATAREYIKKKEYPFSNCIKDEKSQVYQTSVLYQEIIKKQKYRQDICYELLRGYNTIKNCNCSSTRFEMTLGFRRCIGNDQQCMSDQVKLSNLAKLIELYGNLCPLECDSLKFVTKLSTARFPTVSYGNILKKHPIIKSSFNETSAITHNDLEQNTLSFEVFYESFYQTIIEEIPKNSWISLVSALGGLTGLFLGASFLSLFEFFILFIKLFIFFFTST
jgi:hypothetical protein